MLFSFFWFLFLVNLFIVCIVTDGIQFKLISWFLFKIESGWWFITCMMLGLKALSWALTQLFQELYKTRTKAMCVLLHTFKLIILERQNFSLTISSLLLNSISCIPGLKKSDHYHVLVDAFHAVLDNCSGEKELELACCRRLHLRG